MQVLDATTGLPMTSRQIAQATDATNQTGFAGVLGANAGAQKKKGQTLFGPDVGFEEADAVGGWTKADGQMTAGGRAGEESTPTVPLSVVKTWIERAKATDVDPNNARVHKTTTLQARVNLKRPSLSLIALTAVHPDGHSAPLGATTHALRFNYDASSPAVLFTLSIHPRSYHPFLSQRPVTTVYSARHEGGFSKTWQLPAEYAMDLSRMMDDELRIKEQAKRAQEEEEERRRRSAAMDEEDDEEDLKKGHRRHSTSAHPHLPTHQTAATNQAANAATPASAATRSRFGISGIFGRRQRRQDEEQGIVAGIRNAQGGSGPVGGDVMEMQPTAIPPPAAAGDSAAVGGEDKEKDKDVMEEDGIRVLIRLDALDAQGMWLFFLNGIFR